MSTIRFFTSLTLRGDEEIDSSLVPWLPHWATVEFDAARPITAVWQSASGQRRVCWYGDGATAAIRDAHTERYGDEEFWIVHRSDDASAAVTVVECDGHAQPIARRVWTFDRMGLPATEQGYLPSGDREYTRSYECMSDGLVLQLRERRAPSFTETSRLRVREPVIPELAAEPFPSGGTLAGGSVRLIGTIVQNQFQARCRSVHHVDGEWHPSITTLATVSRERLETARAVLGLAGPGIAPLVAEGTLSRARPRPGKTYYGLTEALPPGATIESLVATGTIPTANAIRIVLQLGEVTRRAHARGFELGGLRPELVVVGAVATGLDLAGILHRAPTFLAATYKGEAYLLPPIFLSDFDSRDDVGGLAQLLWFMVTGSHPFLAPDDVTWLDSWSHDRHEERQRQPWRGPPALSSLLERSLFGEHASRPSLDSFLGELRSLADLWV